MRKVRKHVTSIENPALMFARGIESLINDPLCNPSKHDHDEINRMRRASHQPEAGGNLFNALLRQFANL